MMKSNELLKLGSDYLKDKKIKTHLLDAEVILSSLTGKSREIFLTKPNFKIKSSEVISFNKLIARRALKEPVAYLLKKKEFWSMVLNVDKGVLIPRPETEILVEKIVKYFKKQSPFILDVGTGSGCILISLLKELKNSKGIAIDPSAKAINLAKKNAKINKTYDRMRFFNSSINDFNVFNFDLIVSNPPYIASHQLKNLDEGIKYFEPKIALDGGNDGLDVIRKVIYKSKKILKINGMLALEIGNGQYKKVSKILKINKFREKFLIKDYKNNIRCILSILKHY